MTKRGPKPTTRVEKLNKLLGFDVEEALRYLPAEERIDKCWELPKHELTIRENGKRTTISIARALYEIWANEPLTANWQITRRHDCGSKKCVNPTHHRHRMHNWNRTGREDMLPTKLRSAVEPELEEEINEIRRTLDDIDERGEPRPTRQQFIQRHGGLITWLDAALDEVFGRCP